MTAHLPILILLIPLLGGLLAIGMGLWKKGLSFPIALLANLFMTACSFAALCQVLRQGTVRYALAGWPPPFGIELFVDLLAAFVVTVIASIGTLVLIYGSRSVRHETPGRNAPFFALALILEMGLAGMVLTGDLFNLYVFLEIASLAAYALMSVGNERAPLSALRYLYLGSIGASFYLLGLGFLYVLTGSLNMVDVQSILGTQGVSPALLVSLALIVAGFALKMALFPMHSWLPDAYTYASSTATALIAPLMTKVSAYALIRLLFFVYAGASSQLIQPATEVIAWLSAAGILVGSVMAMAQQDFKRMLAYSSVSQIGYIGLGIGLASPLGLIGAVLHILNHALMKACLFMVAGGIQWRTGKTSLDSMRGIGRRLPWTGACLAVACLAMVGIPPTVGFFSKWYLVWAGMEAGRWSFVVVILGGTLLSAVYLFRVLEIVYAREPVGAGPRARPDQGHPRGGAPTIEESQEIPWAMRIPVTVMALGILLIGLGSSWLVTHILTKMVAHV